MWTRWWVLRLETWVNETLHILHWNGFSPLWTRSWPLRLTESEKDRWQVWHWNGLTPKWIFSCLLREQATENERSQIVHWYGFDPECFLRWLTTVDLYLDLYGQVLQRYSLVVSSKNNSKVWRPLLKELDSLLESVESSKFSSLSLVSSWLCIFCKMNKSINI